MHQLLHDLTAVVAGLGQPVARDRHSGEGGDGGCRRQSDRENATCCVLIHDDPLKVRRLNRVSDGCYRSGLDLRVTSEAAAAAG
jgi:hypothetical protein